MEVSTVHSPGLRWNGPPASRKPPASGCNVNNCFAAASAPGAYASEPLDIMSGVEGLVGAETFAAVDPHNNNKLAKDLAKMATRSEQYRYVFFMSPKYPGPKRWPELESAGIQVWSVDVDDLSTRLPDSPVDRSQFPGITPDRPRPISKMATLRYNLDPWRTTQFRCKNCGGRYLGSELADGDNGAERDCPKCQEALLFFHIRARWVRKAAARSCLQKHRKSDN